jgi:hypothetical protein
LDKTKAIHGDRAGGGAESKNESSSEAASVVDLHVMIDPKVRCADARSQAEPVRRFRVLADRVARKVSHFEAARDFILRYHRSVVGHPCEGSGT